MKKVLIAAVALILTASFSFAADNPKATTPVGAVIETSGAIVGKLTASIEKSLGGGKKESSLVLAEDNGNTKIIPLDNSVKALDAGFNVVTLNQLKGKKVSVSSKAGTTTVQEVK